MSKKNELPGKGDKPTEGRSLDELAGTDRDETPVQLNVRVPKYLRKELKRRKIDTDETIEEMVTEALSSFLDS
jgi:hypothetical protein